MKQAGKKLLLITNSDYHYTDKMMRHSFDRFLPNDMSWRDLFDIVSCIFMLEENEIQKKKTLCIGGMKKQLTSYVLSCLKPTTSFYVKIDIVLMDVIFIDEQVIVSARKPEFFQMSHPMYEVVTGEGLMRPCFKAKTGNYHSAPVA